MSLPSASPAHPPNGNSTPSASQHSADLRFMLPRPAPARPGMPAKASMPVQDGSVKARGPFKCWWWWWEIGASLLSLLCVVLITVVLIKFDNTALASWPLWIQPNSLISVFTSIGHSAMMVPIASCISELKWRHFRQQASKLSHLQCLDEASRGPWGSLVVILKLRTKALVVVGFALISLVALGYDPSTQQILYFPQKEVTAPSEDALFWTATEYQSKAYLQDLNFTTYQFGPATISNVDLFKLDSALVNGIAGSVPQPQYTCPGKRCFWDQFNALGICSTYANITDSTSVDCSGAMDAGLDCHYTFPNTSYAEGMNLTFAWQTASSSPASAIFKSAGINSVQGTAELYTIKTVDPYTAEHSNVNVRPATQIYVSTWYLCAQTYSNITITPPASFDANYEAEALQFRDISGISDSDYAISRIYSAPSTGALYTISAIADTMLLPSVITLLTQSLSDMYPHAGLIEGDDDPLGLANFLYTTDIESMTTNLAAALTYQIWSDQQGDNVNATSMLGTTYVMETYIRVTWPWLILPLAETVLTSLLMGVTIYLTWGQPLLKTSLIALLAHRLEGWSDDELAALGKPNDDAALDKLAGGMKARLLENKQGLLRFSRDKSVP